MDFEVAMPGIAAKVSRQQEKIIKGDFILSGYYIESTTVVVVYSFDDGSQKMIFSYDVLKGRFSRISVIDNN